MKNEKSFMSLNKISYGYEINPKWAAGKWLSEPTTLEFIELWESLHNLDFNKDAYIELCKNALSVGTFPVVEELQNYCNVKGIFVNQTFDGEILLHRDLALDFASWISPSFRTFCLLLMNNSNLEFKYNFRSEEDYVISSKTLASITKEQALKNYKQFNSQFVYNCNSVK